MNVGMWARENVGTSERDARGALFRAFVPSSLRPFAFTLIEMLVSLAVLAMAISVVGVVFRITTQTASQAAAYSETLNWVRQFTNQVQEDLRSCDPSQSILVLVGRTQPAARTEDDRVAGKYYRVLLGNPSNVQPAGYDPEFSPTLDNTAQYSNPRADIMMFFSNRPTVSQAPPAGDPPTFTNPMSQAAAYGIKLAPIQVVYGHAALGEADPNGTAYLTTLHHIDSTTGLSQIPLVRWQLARRAVIVAPPNHSGPPNFPADVQFSANSCTYIARCTPYVEFGDKLAGDMAYLNLPFLLETLGPKYYTPAPPLASPYIYPSFPWQTEIQNSVNFLLYATHTGGPTNHHVATILEQVPVGLRSNLGLHMLPGCVWFQVEFLMPEDPRNSLEYTDPNDRPDLSKRTDMPRWTAIDPNSTYVFVPDTEQNRDLVAKQLDAGGVPVTGSRLASFARLDQNPNGDTTNPATALSNRVIRMWPYAIRITVRVYDPRGRLDQPIVRSLVHRFD